MRTVLTISLILLNSVIFAQNNYRVKYLLDFQKDSSDIESMSREIMYLDINNNTSVFQSENLFKKDSISSTNNPYALFGLQKPEFKYKIIQNQIKTVSHFIDYSPSHRFYYEETEQIKWEFLNDTVKKIDQFNCKLAKTKFKGRTYFAWYSIDFPISFGPYKFNGLPGLVIEISDSKKQYSFQLLSLKKLKSLDSFTEINKYKKISKDEFKQLELNIKLKPSLILSNSNLNLPKEGIDKYDKKHRELNKKFNNPIELLD